MGDPTAHMMGLLSEARPVRPFDRPRRLTWQQLAQALTPLQDATALCPALPQQRPPARA